MGDNGGMPFSFGWAYRRLPRSYFWLYTGFEVVSALVVCVATVGLFSLYTEMSAEEFWRVLGFAEACVGVALLYVILKARRIARPLIDWINTGKPAGQVEQAWRCAVAFPRHFVVGNGWQPFVLVALPISVYYTLEFELPFYSAGIIFAGAIVAVAYSAVLHFFASQLFLRPVLEDLANRLPQGFADVSQGVPLRWKLLGALPLINVVTGVVVAGLSTDGQSSLEELGVDVVVALLVAFTISFELTVLVSKSVLRPVDDLIQATEAVKRGDLGARVPLTSGDELGTLAGSFNEMVRGLSERETLHQALGSYVDPDVAERVVEEGALLEGRDVEATILFVDVRGFTSFAERASARETVAFLNGFFDLVVPIVQRHGGHANKFLGDGILVVFGAPERLPDHADRALSAASEIAREVERRFDGEVRIGMGINSGPVVVGSVGGGGKLEFAVIGDPVNVAARVEAATRESGDVVLLTEATRCLLERSEVELQERGEVPLRGKSEPIPVYAAEVLDERPRVPEPRLTAEA